MPTCTRCGFRNVEGARFCGNCGAHVSAVAIPSPPVWTGTLHPRRTGERKKIGLVFLLLFLLLIVSMAVVLFHNDYRTWDSGGKSLFDWTEFAARFHMPAKPAQSTPDTSAAESAQPALGNPTAGPAQPSPQLPPIIFPDGTKKDQFPAGTTYTTDQNGDRSYTFPGTTAKLLRDASGEVWLVSSTHNFSSFTLPSANKITERFETSIMIHLPKTDIVNGPERMRLWIWGNCTSRTYQIVLTWVYDESGMPDPHLASGAENFFHKVEPDTPQEGAFDFICK